MSANPPPTNTAELLDRMHAGRAEFEAALAQISEPDMLRPELDNGWSVKDVLAHTGWWEMLAANIVEGLLDSGWPHPEDDLKLESDADIDQVNADAYARLRDVPLAEAQRLDQEGYARLLALVERASEADLFDPDRFAYRKGRPLFAWVGGNTFWHYDEHLPALRQFIAVRSGQGG